MERQILLIEAMLKVAIKNTSEDILIEAFSIINLILVGNDPILEREKYVDTKETFFIKWELSSLPHPNIMLHPGLGKFC